MEPTAPTEEKKPQTSMLSLLRIRDFRLLWLGQGISLLGNQFHGVAMPWLVLQMTHDPLAMGTVLAVGGIPRALFMLVGGALTDRFSARTLMLGSDLGRLALVSLLAVLVLSARIEVWMLYVVSLVFGLLDAFFYPAENAILPRLVGKDQLQAGNSVIQGTAQLTLFIGPGLAGAMIALLAGAGGPAGAETDLTGIGIAIAFDALTFAVSAVTLWLIRAGRPGDEASRSASRGLFASIQEGLAVVWSDRVLRTFFGLVAAINMLFAGPFMVGIPVLADTRLPGGAVAFGVILSAYGGGMLIGTALAGLLPRPSARRLGPILLLSMATLGIGLVLLGLVASTVLATAISLAMGISDGYVVILFITWLQARTPEAMMGRIMGVLMFAGVGLIPLSYALAGLVVNASLTLLLVGAGSALTVMVVLAAFSPALRDMGPAPAAA